jgi:hypothetical protein
MAVRYRVIVWGTGLIGRYALGHVLRRPEFELVGVKCHTEAKDGRDASDLAEGTHTKTGIRATRDKAALLNLNADVVIFAPFDPMTDPSVENGPNAALVDDLLALLQSGKNVLTTLVTFCHWRQLSRGEELLARIEVACARGKSSFFMSGIDPGLLTDTLAFSLSALAMDVTEINTWEILDYGSYERIEQVRMLGFGSKPEFVQREGAETLRMCWGGCAHAMADAFGVELDDIRVHVDVALAQDSFTSESGLFIEQGTIEAISWKVAGTRASKDLFAINHVTRIGPNAGPAFKRIGHDGGYAIEVSGFPPIRAEFPFGLPGSSGRGWLDAMAVSSFRLVNAIESVVAATPGWRFAYELKQLGGRFALKLNERPV